MWDMLAIRAGDDAAEVLASLEARVWECPTEVCRGVPRTPMYVSGNFKRRVA